MKSIRLLGQVLNVNVFPLTAIILFSLFGMSAFAIQINDSIPLSLIPASIAEITFPSLGGILLNCDFRSIFLILLGTVCGIYGASLSRKKKHFVH